MKKIVFMAGLLALSFILSGCGETINGAVKDTKRIGEGIHKIFIKD
ncbi:MAG: hypothetical protein KJ983_00715 [Candidatus Omnitrophica bacterium]|nr:hypothetical protein [Candidatus Omnitrophota bacterium]